MKKVLIVEDSGFFGSMISNKFKADGAFKAVWVRSMTDAVAAIDNPENKFFAAILDFNLPDASQGEIIDVITARDIPVIVFTSDISEKVREIVWSKNVADYALKDDFRSLDYIINMLKRFRKNPEIKVLVVDDSTFFRKILSDLLKLHRYHVLNARNGVEALDILEKHPDIKLVITDFNMPEMDGFTLITRIRKRYNKNELAIIGVSSEGNNILAARFIKKGANDFLIKQSFLTEEFYCRVTQCIENLEHIQAIKNAAVRDFLTGLNNRRYFFAAGSKLFANAMRKNISLSCAMLDIDHFKKINDTYGHKTGDKVLRHISNILKSRMRESDIVARLGGEEFCILAVNMSSATAERIFNMLRQKIADSVIRIDDGRIIQVTVSIGVVTELAGSLDDMVNRADKLLYKAKSSGRNTVIMSSGKVFNVPKRHREKGKRN